MRQGLAIRATRGRDCRDAFLCLDGAIIFKNACALGCEGIVSKRLGSPYRLRAHGPLAQDQESRLIVQNEIRDTVWSIPLLPGCA
jgi:hypothetical protein